MEIKKVATESAPAAIGPYSQAIICGEMVFTSGQIPINPASGNIEAEGISAQTEQVMKNLGEVLSAAGSSFAFLFSFAKIYSHTDTLYRPMLLSPFEEINLRFH